MAGHLLYKNTIAGAVAREVVRGGPDGIAYKCELARQGGYVDVMQLVEDAARDAQVMYELTARRPA